MHIVLHLYSLWGQSNKASNQWGNFVRPPCTHHFELLWYGSWIMWKLISLGLEVLHFLNFSFDAKMEFTTDVVVSSTVKKCQKFFRILWPFGKKWAIFTKESQITSKICHYEIPRTFSSRNELSSISFVKCLWIIFCFSGNATAGL